MVLPRRSPLKENLIADLAAMKISNQKNGRMGQTLHQREESSTGTNLDAVTGLLARQVHHVLSLGGGNESNLISDVYLQDKWTSITGSNMVTSIRKNTSTSCTTRIIRHHAGRRTTCIHSEQEEVP